MGSIKCAAWRCYSSDEQEGLNWGYLGCVHSSANGILIPELLRGAEVLYTSLGLCKTPGSPTVGLRFSPDVIYVDFKAVW